MKLLLYPKLHPGSQAIIPITVTLLPHPQEASFFLKFQQKKKILLTVYVQQHNKKKTYIISKDENPYLLVSKMSENKLKKIVSLKHHPCTHMQIKLKGNDQQKILIIQ